MSKTRNQDFLRGSSKDQTRIVGAAGLATIGIAAVIAVNVVWVYPHFAPTDALRLSIDVPSVAPGVAEGTKVILHGAEVGEVEELQHEPAGEVRMNISLNPNEIEGLTDTFALDFRTENYFGVTAVNLVGVSGGNALASGSVLDRTPQGDFTMSKMLEESALVVDGTLSESMIDTMNKVIRYTDGLTPMIETGIIVADRVAQTQQALPSDLLGRFNDVLAEMPGFTREALTMVFGVYDTDYNVRQPDGTYIADGALLDETEAGMQLVGDDLFGAAGTLLASHGTELTPGAGIIEAFSDAIPGLLAGGSATGKVTTLVDRLDGAFTVDGGITTLDIRIVLDDFPGFAAPLAITGLPQLPNAEEPR